MAFIFDRGKSKSNKEKHGIDFSEAQSIWTDPHLAAIPSGHLDEERFIMIGKIKGKIWSAIVTHRNDDTRIISVRRARRKEVEIYEGN